MEDFHCFTLNDKILYCRFDSFSLCKALRNLQSYCELVLFSVLERGLIDEIFKKVPELSQIFNIVITRSDPVFFKNSEYLIKDLRCLLGGRTQETIVVVEANLEYIDETTVCMFEIQPYEPKKFEEDDTKETQLGYSSLFGLKQAVKEAINQI